jgi:hypothetical protein
MNKLYLISAASLMVLAATVCQGQVVEDPLHGYCSVGCIGNGTNTPTSQNPITGFGFTVSPASQTGILIIDVLVPGNEQTTSATYAITGDRVATAILVSATDWTSGFLAAYLGITASPANGIGAFLPSTQALDPAAIGFSVYRASLGTMTLLGSGSPGVAPLLTISALPIGSYIVGFLDQGTAGIIATANSGAIFETTTPPGGGGNSGGGDVPEPASIILLGTVSLGVCTIIKKKARSRA